MFPLSEPTDDEYHKDKENYDHGEGRGWKNRYDERLTIGIDRTLACIYTNKTPQEVSDESVMRPFLSTAYD